MRVIYICDKCDHPIYPYVGCHCKKQEGVSKND